MDRNILALGLAYSLGPKPFHGTFETLRQAELSSSFRTEPQREEKEASVPEILVRLRTLSTEMDRDVVCMINATSVMLVGLHQRRTRRLGI